MTQKFSEQSWQHREKTLVKHLVLESACLGLGGAFRHDGYFDGNKPYAKMKWERLIRHGKVLDR
jgi:hypothetical protein